MKEQEIWTAYVSRNRARGVARALKAAGYPATVAKCHGYVINVARYFEPGDMTERANVLDIIAQAAGITPRS